MSTVAPAGEDWKDTSWVLVLTMVAQPVATRTETASSAQNNFLNITIPSFYDK